MKYYIPYIIHNYNYVFNDPYGYYIAIRVIKYTFPFYSAPHSNSRLDHSLPSNVKANLSPTCIPVLTIWPPSILVSILSRTIGKLPSDFRSKLEPKPESLGRKTLIGCLLESTS